MAKQQLWSPYSYLCKKRAHRSLSEISRTRTQIYIFIVLDAGEGSKKPNTNMRWEKVRRQLGATRSDYSIQLLLLMLLLVVVVLWADFRCLFAQMKPPHMATLIMLLMIFRCLLLPQTNLGAKWRARTTSSSSFVIRIHG